MTTDVETSVQYALSNPGSAAKQKKSSAMVASTNGAMSRYCEIEKIGVISALTRPTTIAAMSVTTIDCSRAISVAASDEMNRNVKVAASRPMRLASSKPDAPESRPEN